jgi:UDP-2,3-diacylglucosamine pyrophosphatase LpxH
LGSSTVPFEQIGHSAMKRLWRQKDDTCIESRASGAARLPPLPPMRTAVVSDLHLGGHAGADIAREPKTRAALVDAVSGSSRLVLLGDILELRERPLAQALELARPLFEALGEAMAGRRVVLVPGNHDHALAEPWLSRLRVDGEPLPIEADWPVSAGDGPAGRLAEWMPEVELTLAYPGLTLRADVYATHGHYLDLHLTVPRLEAIAAAAMGWLTGLGKSARSAADYEAVLGPLYTFYSGVAQGASPAVLSRGARVSRDVWNRVSDGGAPGGRAVAARAIATRFLLGQVTIPGAVAALNGLGLGPFRATLTGEELRRSGLAAMASVAEVLAPDIEHVIFGHTHRPGPLPGDELDEWTTPSGTRLWNTGSWLHEGAFVRTGRDSPYWPGTVLTLVDEDQPRIENVLHG